MARKATSANGIAKLSLGDVLTARKRPIADAKRPPQREPKIGLPPYHPVEAFKPVAALITPEPPEWLAEYFWHLSSTIYMNHAVEGRLPTRAEMARILEKVRDAAALLQRALGEPSVCEFLNAGGSVPIDFPIKFQMIVGELQIRAERASRLPNLANHKGKAKGGRGRAHPCRAMSAQTYCALLIAEAWKWFRGKYPPPRNRQAAEAIDIYWRLAGGKRDGWGNDPLTAWRYHFNKAATTPAEQDRAELRRRMRESAHYADFLKSGVALDGGK